MRVALAVNYVTFDAVANLNDMESLVREAADAGAELVLFGECATTGAQNNDDPIHDLPLGVPVPGPVTERFGRLARELNLHIGTGLIERDGGVLYCTFVLIGSDGSLILKYRRISPGWHGRRADPLVYGHGSDVQLVTTPGGTASCLICGDIGNDDLISRVRAMRPDMLLFPFTRDYEDNSWDDARWQRDDQAFYNERARALGTTVLMVGYLADPALGEGGFGGAFVISPGGQLLARKPLGERGLLLADLPR